MKVLVLAALLWPLLPNSGLTYEGKVHQEISKSAVKIYNSCAEKLGPNLGLKKLDRQNSYSLSLGSLHEDKKNPISRAKNWHFYRANDQMPKNALFDSSNETIFKKRVKRLKLLSDFKIPKVYINYYFGRLVHHIQDMAVPAHVVPIYHAAPPFGAEDSFDKYKVSNSSLIDMELSARECEDILNEEIDWYELLEEVAQDTIASIDNATWERFWPQYEVGRFNIKVKGFGSYGELGNTFGTNTEYTKEEYDKFAAARYKKALLGTVRALMKLKKMH